ncbi:DUF2202 domain-containing protein [Candidatus Dojkabacteria bacterium]|uniref:DUF2202 domain-containing protein n=1 Tax=Candidatus Dojkabacteria bacterium TaxID=2099670 RepID=A0A955L854_9BACT|nr:DUF2202 domain-containing protein [Candidatus Dojkabacteria bacterium]
MKNKQVLYPLLGIAVIASGVAVFFAGVYFTKTVSQTTTESDVVADFETVDSHDHLYVDEYFKSLPKEELSQEEIDGLLLMREEEKLAHDVYITLYEKWGQNIFSNISKSEQTHTDMVASLLIKYDIEDPVKTNDVGVFQNTDFSKLYTELVEQGEQSLIDALTVGATVEDLDIKDLQTLMEQSDNQDIVTVYQNLTKGSRNHLRAFTRMLNRNGALYEAQYITESEYQEIIDTPSENGVFYDAKGKGRNW